MQYTIRNIPSKLDEQLRERAEREGKSLNRVVVEALLEAMQLDLDRPARRDVSEIVGSWIEDPEVDAALDAQRQIDDELWR